MDLPTLLYIVYAVLGLGVIIFIHELGHFLAAKKAGVRVDRFSIGFDPPLFGRNLRLYSTTIGETEYVIGLIPLGGYVKMAGETQMAVEESEGRDASRGGPPPADWLIAKPAGSRAVVFAAGAIFNIVSAIFFFAIAFLIGVKFVRPSVGNVEPGMPAWEEGLRAGDEILAIGGEPIKTFDEIPMAAALRDSDAMLLSVKRGDQIHEIEVTPVYRPERGLKSIGIFPAVDWHVVKVDAGSPAQEAGIAPGDRVVGFRQGSVEFVNLPTMDVLLGVINAYTSYAPGRPYDLLVEGKGWLAITPKRDEAEEGRVLLGVVSQQTRVIEGVQPGSGAARVFEKGDRILTINGNPFVSLVGPKLAASYPDPNAPLELEIEAADASTRKSSVPRDDLLLWSATGQIYLEERGARIGALEPGSPLHKAGLRARDIVERIGTRDLEKPEDLDASLLEDESRSDTNSPEVALHVIRDGKRLAEPVEVPLELLTGKEAPLAWDRRPRLVVMGSEVPAARLGIEDGSIVDRIGDRAIEDWEQLTAAVQSIGEKGKEVAVAWTTPDGDSREGRVELLVDAYQPLGLRNRRAELTLQTANPLAAVQLGLERTLLVAKRVYLTLRALFKKDGVSARLLSGPLGIVHIMVLVSEMGIGKLIYFLAMISINLGIFNLLPFPILDGGHLLFLLIEKIKGSPVSVRVQEIATTVAFFLLIGLVIFVTYNDILRLVHFS